MDWESVRRWQDWRWRKPPQTLLPPLVEAVEEARLEWCDAQLGFREASEKDLVDQAVHRLAAAERRYMHLLKQAREEGVSAASLRGPAASLPEGNILPAFIRKPITKQGGDEGV